MINDDLSKKKSPHFREKYLVLSYLKKRTATGIEAPPKNFLFSIAKVEEDRVGQNFVDLKIFAKANYSVPTRRWTTVQHTHFRLYFSIKIYRI